MGAERGHSCYPPHTAARPAAWSSNVGGETHAALTRIEVLEGVYGVPVGARIYGTADDSANAGKRFDRANRHFMRWSWIPRPIRRILPLVGPGGFDEFMNEMGSISDDMFAGFGGDFDPESGKLTLTCGWGGDPAEHVEATVGDGPLSGTRWSIPLDASGLVKGVEVDGFGKCLTDLQRAMFSSEGGDAYFDVPEFQEAVTGYFNAMQLPVPAWLHQPRLRTADAIGQTQAAIGKKEDAKLAAAYDDRLPYDFDELLNDVWVDLHHGELRNAE